MSAALAAGVLLTAGLVAGAVSPGPARAVQPERRFGLVIHGGEGVTSRGEMTAERERQYRDALQQAVSAGWTVLRDGGTSVAAVEAAIRVMEDSPLFNAGKGASYNRAGFNELDAAIMDGATLKAGAVAVVRHVRNPISLARLVMDRSPHVLMAGEGAEAFALEQGMPLVPPSYFYTEHKWRSLQLRLQQETPYGRAPVVKDAPDLDPALSGTVGAAALDRSGNLAAGTSTGGREGKLPGRVGDSPIIGAGTYASNESLAVSSTGTRRIRPAPRQHEGGVGPDDDRREERRRGHGDRPGEDREDGRQRRDGRDRPPGDDRHAVHGRRDVPRVRPV